MVARISVYLIWMYCKIYGCEYNDSVFLVDWCSAKRCKTNLMVQYLSGLLFLGSWNLLFTKTSIMMLFTEICFKSKIIKKKKKKRKGRELIHRARVYANWTLKRTCCADCHLSGYLPSLTEVIDLEVKKRVTDFKSDFWSTHQNGGICTHGC